MSACIHTYILQTGPRSGFLHSYGAGKWKEMDFALEVCLCVYICVVGGGAVVLFPGSTALNPGAVSPSCTRTLSTPSTGRFGLRAAAGHAAGHATCGEHKRQQY